MESCGILLPPSATQPHQSFSSASPDREASSFSDISSAFFDHEYDWASLQQHSNADSCNVFPSSAVFLSAISDSPQLNPDQLAGFDLSFQKQQQQIQYVAHNDSCFQMASPVKPLKSLKRESPDQSTLVSCEDSSPSSARSGVYNPNCPEMEHSLQTTPTENHAFQNKRICLDQSLPRWSTPSNDSKHKLSTMSFIGPALNTNGKPRAKRGSATDPQSVYARHRRERINERLKTLQHLVPNGAKVDIVTMLEEAIHYVKFLQLQVNMLSSDEYWIYAPTTYNGPETPLGNLQWPRNTPRGETAPGGMNIRTNTDLHTSIL